MVVGRSSLEELKGAREPEEMGLSSSVVGRGPLKMSEFRVVGDSAFGDEVLLQSGHMSAYREGQ